MWRWGIGIMSRTGRAAGIRTSIDRVQNASIYRDVEFSYRVAGEVKLEMMEEGRARIAVREGEPLTQYEIFATSTGGTCEYAPLEFKVKRIF